MNARMRASRCLPPVTFLFLLLASLPCGRLASSEQEPTLAARLTALVEQLGSPTFSERESAQGQLQEFGSRSVPILRQLQSESNDPETQWRLAMVIRANSRPRWQTDIETAGYQSVRTGKLIMVFSTIGEIDGFS